jgi:hypothetical protein
MTSETLPDLPPTPCNLTVRKAIIGSPRLLSHKMPLNRIKFSLFRPHEIKRCHCLFPRNSKQRDECWQTAHFESSFTLTEWRQNSHVCPLSGRENNKTWAWVVQTRRATELFINHPPSGTPCPVAVLYAAPYMSWPKRKDWRGITLKPRHATPRRIRLHAPQYII